MPRNSNFRIGGISARFASQWPLEDTRRRLIRLTRWSKDSQDLEGSVTDDQVTLSVMHLGRSNGTAFRGQLKELNDEVFLEGRFSASAYAQGTTMVALSFVVVMAIGGVTSEVGMMLESGDVFGRIGGLFTFAAGLMGFGALMVWNASPSGKDVARLTEALKDALGRDA